MINCLSQYLYFKNEISRDYALANIVKQYARYL